MELVININIKNAAFCDIPELEVSRILIEYSARIERGGLPEKINLYDFNGNNVGQAKIIKGGKR